MTFPALADPLTEERAAYRVVYSQAMTKGDPTAIIARYALDGRVMPEFQETGVGQ
ncbi:MAG: hypothetical protein AAFR03_14820 [Pseudomonadota bacterium]